MVRGCIYIEIGERGVIYLARASVREAYASTGAARGSRTRSMCTTVQGKGKWEGKEGEGSEGSFVSAFYIYQGYKLFNETERSG